MPSETSKPTGSPSPGGRAHHQLRRLRPSGAPAGGALPLARPSAVPARPIPDVLRGPGQPLAAPLRKQMQARLGADLSDVRVHTGSAARTSAAELGARAYTAGSHIVLGDGGTDTHTLAHELTHVIQQRTGPVAGTSHGTGFNVSDPSDAYEKAAEANAARVMQTPLKEEPETRFGPQVSDPGDRAAEEAAAMAAQVMAGPAQAPAAGHHRPASRAAGATLQRLLVAQITSHDGETIEDLNIVGRPPSPYKGTMGDHSTAFAVQVEAIRRRVLRLDPGADHQPRSLKAADAAQAIVQLINEVEQLPGAALIENLPDTHKNDIKTAREHLRAQCHEFTTGKDPEPTDLLKIQKMIGDFLHYRELIPLTTINVKAVSPARAGKGKGESGPNQEGYSGDLVEVQSNNS